MTSDRCYRAALSLEQVHAEITHCSGQQFDPDLARVFQSVPDHRWIELRNDADAQAASFNPFLGE
jgi:HD-GYP domain-containing protein (c-di-GMP phosphodiesterase class II)